MLSQEQFSADLDEFGRASDAVLEQLTVNVMIDVELVATPADPDGWNNTFAGAERLEPLP